MHAWMHALKGLNFRWDLGFYLSPYVERKRNGGTVEGVESVGTEIYVYMYVSVGLRVFV